MTTFKEKTGTGKIIYISSVLGAIIGIITGLGYFVNQYFEYKNTQDVMFQEKVEQIIEEKDALFKKEVLYELNKVYENSEKEIDTLKKHIKDLREGSQYFAIGYRGDGTGNIFYRDAYGTVHKTYWNDDLHQYYYIDERGRAVYI